MIAAQSFARMHPSIAKRARWRYRASVTVNPVAGCGSPNKQKAHKRHRSTAGVFLCPPFRFMVAVCGRRSRLPGSFCPGLPHPHTVAAHHVEVMPATPQQKEPHP